MSEKVENEIEEEEERKMLNHWSHEHPLSDLVVIHSLNSCIACSQYFRRGERGYRCSQECGYEWLLHEECAEAPRKIRHAMHPQHTLAQQYTPERWQSCCCICQGYLERISYRCTSAECTFKAHVRCAQGSDMMYGAEDGERSIIHHPSHPNHQLKLFRRSCAFKCDACGTTHAKGSSYTCLDVDCQYWIHQRCASLPHTVEREEHHHSLSLSFHVPLQYLRYNYRCEVCSKRLITKYWIYHCEVCSYALHLTCAFTKSLHTTREKGTMVFPINDVAVGEDLIGAFLRRQGVDAHTLIPHQDDVDYEFHHHKLTLVSSSSSSFEEEEEGDDDEEDYSCRKSELICDGCITPILVKQTSLSSSSSSSSCSGSSSSKDNYYYMRCSMRSCKYYLHLACFHMPTQLSSLPLTHEHENDHSFLLQSGDKLQPWEWTYCRVCCKYTNGLFYTCTKCDYFRVDIKCASMPDTIYHAAHPNHLLHLRSAQDMSMSQGFIYCDACESYTYNVMGYECSICDFFMHVGCAGLPASTTSRRWDKHHPLLLTHNATLNHPGEFYCNQCEEGMNPKSLMYHCRSCDISIHPSCFKTTSGWCRNIKLGQEYHVNAEIHPHPLTFQLLTTKRRCDICHYNENENQGFYCAFCNFFICFYRCGKNMIKDGNIEAVD